MRSLKSFARPTPWRRVPDFAKKVRDARQRASRQPKFTVQFRWMARVVPASSEAAPETSRANSRTAHERNSLGTSAMMADPSATRLAPGRRMVERVQIGNVTGHIDRRDLSVPVPPRRASKDSPAAEDNIGRSRCGVAPRSDERQRGRWCWAYPRAGRDRRSGQISEARQSVCELGEGKPCLHQASIRICSAPFKLVSGLSH